VLRELKRQLGRAFHEPDARAPQSAALLAGLRPLAAASPAESLEIYQSAVARALEAALQEIFPVCLALVGEDCFRSIAREYDAARTAAHADLARAGDELPGFLPSLRFLDGVPYLAGVAAVELAVQKSRRARSQPAAADAAAHVEAAAADPFGWRLVLATGAQLVESEYPVLSIWRAHQDTADPGALESIDPSAGGERVVIWPGHEGTQLDAVDTGLFALLEAIAAGRSLAALLTLGDRQDLALRDDLVDEDPEDYALVLGRIGEILERGLVAGAERMDPASALD